MLKIQKVLLILSTQLHNFVSGARNLVATNWCCDGCRCDITTFTRVGLGR